MGAASISRDLTIESYVQQKSALDAGRTAPGRQRMPPGGQEQVMPRAVQWNRTCRQQERGNEERGPGALSRLPHPEISRALWLLQGQQNGKNDASIEVELQGHSIATRGRRLSNFIGGRVNLREGIAINTLGRGRHKGGIRSSFILRAICCGIGKGHRRCGKGDQYGSRGSKSQFAHDEIFQMDVLTITAIARFDRSLQCELICSPRYSQADCVEAIPMLVPSVRSSRVLAEALPEPPSHRPARWTRYCGILSKLDHCPDGPDG